MRFRAAAVELELEVGVTCTGDGPEGIHLGVMTLDGRSPQGPATTHRLKVSLRPLPPEVGRHEPPASFPGYDVTVSPAPAEAPSLDSAGPERPVRAQGLEVHEVDDGLVIYQAKPERVHHLNNTAAVVFDLCDGGNTISEITDHLILLFGLDELPANVAEECVVDLRSKGIVH
jgi:hypothetical protein